MNPNKRLGKDSNGNYVEKKCVNPYCGCVDCQCKPKCECDDRQQFKLIDFSYIRSQGGYIRINSETKFRAEFRSSLWVSAFASQKSASPPVFFTALKGLRRFGGRASKILVIILKIYFVFLGLLSKHHIDISIVIKNILLNAF